MRIIFLPIAIFALMVAFVAYAIATLIYVLAAGFVIAGNAALEACASFANWTMED